MLLSESLLSLLYEDFASHQGRRILLKVKLVEFCSTTWLDEKFKGAGGWDAQAVEDTKSLQDRAPSTLSLETEATYIFPIQTWSDARLCRRISAGN